MRSFFLLCLLAACCSPLSSIVCSIAFRLLPSSRCRLSLILSFLTSAQSWVTKGPYLTRLDIKGRGRFGVKHHPSAKLHVLLAEGRTEEQRRRERKVDQWRASIRGLTEGDGVGVGKGGKKIINAEVGGWRW